MPGHFLYSTNSYIKQLIQRQFRRDLHYVYCSEVFDARVHGVYSPYAELPPSSNPAEIYRDLRAACASKDRHNEKIASVKNSILRLASEWQERGEITASDEAEIAYILRESQFDDWRPMIYVIRRDLVEPRLREVPITERAGRCIEYIIEDLRREEFDMLEIAS